MPEKPNGNRCKTTCFALSSGVTETLPGTLLYVVWTSQPGKKKKMDAEFQFECQHLYLSSRASLLIKMNGCLMTGVVSFNVIFMFIFHPNIPHITLSEDSSVYKPSQQSSRVTTTALRFPSLSLSSISLYLPVFPCPRPLLSYNLCFAFLCFNHQRWANALASHSDYITHDSFSSFPLLLLLVANTHTERYITWEAAWGTFKYWWWYFKAV